MSQHRTLKKSKAVGSKRNVLKRFERIKEMKKRGTWKKGMSPYSLPKIEIEQ